MLVFFNPGIVLFITLLHLTPVHTNSITSKLLSDLFGGHKPEDLVVTTVKPIIVEASSTIKPTLPFTSTMQPTFPSTTTDTPVFPPVSTTIKPVTEKIVVPGHNGTCGIFRNTFQRIAGGYDAPRDFYPYIATIRELEYSEWENKCGATLIHPRFVLTAAHCFGEFAPVYRFRVVVGVWDNTGREETEQRATIKKIHIHPRFRDYHEHDIAIVELNAAVRLNKHVALACLPHKNFNYYPGRLCTVKGWGRTNSGAYPTKLQVGLVPIIDRQTCKGADSNYEDISETSFCAGYFDGGIDTCGGDSGGPLVCQEGDGSLHVVGVTSWGIGCAQKNKPGVYTTVAAYIDWIEKILKGEAQ